MGNTPEVAMYEDNQITIFATEQLLNSLKLVGKCDCKNDDTAVEVSK